MPLDLYQLDAITDFDEAIDRLDEYVAKLVEELVEAPKAKRISRRILMWKNLSGVGFINCFTLDIAIDDILPR